VGMLAEALVPGAMAAFRRHYPKAEVRIASGFGPPLLAQLREGLIEFAVTLLPPSHLQDKGIKVAPLFKNWRVVVGRRGHPMRNVAALDKLVDSDWMVQSPPEMLSEPTPWWFFDLFEKNGVMPPKSIVRCEGHVFTRLLLTTDMIGVQPPYSILFQLGAIEAFKVNSCRPASSMYTEYLVQRADTPLTPAAAAMLRAIKVQARALAFAKAA